MKEKSRGVGYHGNRQFNGKELPDDIEIKLVDSLSEVGGPINGLEAKALVPNCLIETMNGEALPCVWYLNNPASRGERVSFAYNGVNEENEPTKYSFEPAGWVFIDGAWLPMVLRLLRVIDLREMDLNDEYFNKVIYASGDERKTAGEMSSGKAAYVMASLGAAGNTFNIAYLLTDPGGNLLPSPAKDKWLVQDLSDIGFGGVCGAGERVYGAGCYFGGMWVCANRGGARKTNEAVCKPKDYSSQYFWAVADGYVYNSKGGGSIKAGRVKLLNEEQISGIPGWVKFV
jgi:hypothetical protein